MVEDYINGQGSNRIFIKDNSSKVKEMEEEPSGGLMEVGTKDNLGMEYKVDMEYYIEMVAMLNMKDLGITVCSMVKVLNSSRMVKNTKDLLNKISSMEMVYFIRMILLYTESGKIMSYL